MAAVALGAQAAGTGLSAWGQLSAANYNARVQRSNAAAMDAAARDAEDRARLDAEAIRLETGQRIGQQRAGLAAANVDISRGSAAELSIATAEVGELEVLRTLNNAAREAWGLRTQADFARADARMTRRLGALNAGTTILGGVADMFGTGRMLRGK